MRRTSGKKGRKPVKAGPSAGGAAADGRTDEEIIADAVQEAKRAAEALRDENERLSILERMHAQENQGSLLSFLERSNAQEDRSVLCGLTEAHPAHEHIMRKVMDRLAFLDEQVARTDRTVPRVVPKEVVAAMKHSINVLPLEKRYLVDGSTENRTISLRFTQFMQEDLNMGVGVNLLDGGSLHTDPLQAQNSLMIIPWRVDMDYWGALDWAWLVASAVHKCGLARLDACFVSHKFSRVPSPSSAAAFADAFVDVAHSPCWGGALSGCGYPDLEDPDPGAVQSDLALAFDVSVAHMLLEVCGVRVEDRSKDPAKTFLVGAGTCAKVRDSKGKVFADARHYVEHRLKHDKVESAKGAEAGAAAAAASPQLSAAELLDLAMDVLESQSVPGAQTGYARQGHVNGYEMAQAHTAFMEKTFPRRLRKAFSKHSVAVPEHLRAAAKKCCAHCGAVPLSGSALANSVATAGGGEGGGAESTEKKEALKLGACGRCKVTFYCRGTKCQTDHWPAHKARCKELTSGSGSGTV